MNGTLCLDVAWILSGLPFSVFWDAQKGKECSWRSGKGFEGNCPPYPLPPHTPLHVDTERETWKEHGRNSVNTSCLIKCV